jgi:hypothetical protein
MSRTQRFNACLLSSLAKTKEVGCAVLRIYMLLVATEQGRSERWVVSPSAHLTIWREGAFQQLSALEVAILAVSVRQLARDHAEHFVISYFFLLLFYLFAKHSRAFIFSLRHPLLSFISFIPSSPWTIECLTVNTNFPPAHLLFS